MKEILRLGLVLMVIAGAAASVLTATNAVTGPRIAEQLEREKTEALSVVMPTATDFIDAGEKYADLLADPRFAGIVQEVWLAEAGGSEIGAVYVVAPVGYGGPIVTLVGIDLDLNVTGVAVLSAGQETPGLGLLVTEEWFTARFAGRDVSRPLQVVTGEPTRADEIESITAATISVAAVVRGVNVAAEFHQVLSRDAAATAGSYAEELARVLPAGGFRDLSDQADPIVSRLGFGDIVTEVWEGHDADDEPVGYVLSTVTRGFGGDVVLLVGFDSDSTITGITVLAMAGETEDVGTSIAEPEFLNQFIGRQSEVALVKSNARGDEILALTGATLSSRAVVLGVNAALAVVAELIAGGDGK